MISDDLQMLAIAEHYTLQETVQKALEAGVDILLFGNNLSYDVQIAERVIAIIEQLVADKVIDEAQIDQSYRRILDLKQNLLAAADGSEAPSP